MKDNKYQELMSHINVSPETEKKVMEALENDMSIPRADSHERVYEKVPMPDKRRKKRISPFRIGGIAAAACLVLLISTVFGINYLSGKNEQFNEMSFERQDEAGESPDQVNDNSYADYDDESAVSEGEEPVSDEDAGYAPAESAGIAGDDDAQAASAGTTEDNKSGSSDDSAGLGADDLKNEDKNDKGAANDKNAAEKLVYTCTLTLQTTDYNDSIKKVRDAIKAVNGFIENEHEYSDDLNSAYDAGSGQNKETSVKHNHLVIRVPADQYETFLSGVDAYGTVTEKTQNVQNITKAYRDTETRIKALRIQEKRLLDLMKKAKTISEMIEVEDRLTEVQAELESWQNSKTEMDVQVSYATIEMDLCRVKKISRQEDAGFASKAKEYFQAGLNIMVNIFRWLALTVIFLLPLILLALATAAVVIFIIRRRRKKDLSKK